VPWIGAAPSCEQAQVVVQASEQTVQPQRCAARRGQLDRQRHAFEPGAQLIDGRSRAESRADGAGTVGEQYSRLRTGFPTVHVGNQRQRRHRHQVLPGDREPLTAGCQHPHAGTCRQHPLGERGHLGKQMLAVVEHEQRPPRRQVLKHGFGQRLLGPFGNPKHRRRRLGDETLPHRHQVDEGAA
jgi:hypothetical protein